jgi:tRNA A37 threonylcarbamoyladenosine dehydratase
MLIGEAALERLKSSRVAVLGVGGVGGYTVEALARAGVGSIDLFDSDTVAESNINRQIIATYDTVGRKKTEVARERILQINPECRVTCHDVFLLPENIDAEILGIYDYVVDAIDTVSAKIAVAKICYENNIPLISSMGTGNKLDPTALTVTDIYKTSVCPLARVMRTELRKRGVGALKVVYSTEEPIAPIPEESFLENAEKPDTPRRQTPASISFVPSAAGLIAASEVVRYLIKDTKK